MQAWVWITFAAALAQTLRFMLQKRLAGSGLSAAGATFARFLYGLPMVALGLWVYGRITGQAIEIPDTARFWAFALAGGLGQILATVAVVMLFSMRNFAVGITLKKTETLQTALIGYVLLGEWLSPLGLAGIVIGFFAVLILSDRGGARLALGLDKSAGLGLLSGALFGISAVCYRGASLSITDTGTFERAATTLLCVVISQTVIMAIWFALRDPGQVRKVLAAWPVASLVGVTSIIGSICWFLAFTLQNAALVHAVGQVELAFSILVGMWVFGERISGREWLGMGLLAASILVIVIGI